MSTPLRDRINPPKKVVPEWVRRMREGKLPAKDMTEAENRYAWGDR